MGSSDKEAKKVYVIALNLTKPHLRMAPQIAQVVKPPVMRPVDSSTEARLIWRTRVG